MKKIVPFKKNITLDTNIAQIESISLEHTLEKVEENVVSGNFVISGTYKMNQTSINIDNFEYKLPVNISIDKKYKTEDIIIDIHDFYYEIINDKILQINIEVLIDNLEEKEVEEEIVLENNLENVEMKQNKTERRENVEENKNEEVNSIFNTIDDNDNYVVYKIHIVTENDTIESIIEEYNTTRENIEQYNDLSNVQIGDKIIIANDDK